MADHQNTMVATDVHQHLWPEGFVAALAARSDAPAVRRDGRGWVISVPGEPDSPFGTATHDPVVRAAGLRATGLDRALLCMSTPLGVEALDEDQSRPLLDAWHDGVFAAGDVFGVWGALPVHGAVPGDVDALLDRGAVGISLPAAALASPSLVEAAGPVLAALAARDAPLFVHPGPIGPPAAARDDGDAAWWPALTTYVSDVHLAWHAFLGWGLPSHPTLRVCFAMLAGLAPLHAERLSLRGGPAEAINNANLFYDTSSYGPRAIAAMAGVVGVDQLVTGSDRPVVDPPLHPPLGKDADALMSTTNVHRLLHGRSVPT
ncbi:amidohydrolase [Baekduia sp. Peel2402]|uniref:amidohydrolase n=1 Tax=Baekduia sp. Peel2402 TaxID=3458296 RepID=UPI00403E42A7